MENTKIETDLINCLDGSNRFLKDIVASGCLDENAFLKTFVVSQIDCNELTIKEYKK